MNTPEIVALAILAPLFIAYFVWLYKAEKKAKQKQTDLDNYFKRK